MLKKIVVIGPESTGKSYLCEQLANHFNSIWVKEFAREYLLTNGKEYTYDTLLTISKGQMELENESVNHILKNFSASTTTPLFIDTDFYVLKVWCEFVFGKCHHSILTTIAQNDYDLFLLCNTDLPWVADDLREYPNLKTREILYRHYKDILVNQQVKWVEISGDYTQRIQTAIAAVETLLQHN